MTPIENAKNIGPVVGSELRECGIKHLEDLIELGLEESFYQLVLKFPERLNLNCIVAMYGAVENMDWREIDPEVKERLKKYLEKLRKLHKKELL